MGTIRLKSLEALRFCAAISVIFTHVQTLSDVPILKLITGQGLFLGSIGVDVFFVISGFVMASSAFRTKSGVKNALDFLLDRIFRIFPLYLTITLIHLPIAFSYGDSLDFKYFYESILLLPTRDQSTFQFIDPIVIVGWTLRFELFFYVLVTIGVALKRRVFVPVAGLCLAFCAWFNFGFYYGAPIILEFIMGYLLYSYRFNLLHRVEAKVGTKTLALGWIVSFGILLFVSTGRDWILPTHGMYSDVPRMWIQFSNQFEFPRAIAWGIPSFAIVYFSLCLERKFKWKISFLGKYTYSVYLVQLSSHFLANKIAAFLEFHEVVTFALYLFLTGVLGFACYKLVEIPFVSLRKKFRTEIREKYTVRASKVLSTNVEAKPPLRCLKVQIVRSEQ